jgi:hypothetical protein
MKHRSLTSAALALLLAGGLAAQSIAPFSIPLSRFGSMGGAHAALADDWSLLFANPAGLASAKPRLLAAQLGVRASGPLFDIGLALLGGGSMVGNVMNVLKTNNYKLSAGADIAGPLSFGYVGKGIGFGLFNRSRMLVDASGISTIRLVAEEDVLLVGGYAFGLNFGPDNRVEAGILAKGFARGGIDKTMDALALLGIVSDFMQKPFGLTTGIGIDLGVRWAGPLGLSAGLVCRDLYSPIQISSYSTLAGFIADPTAVLVPSLGKTANLYRDLDLGFAWTMPDGGFWGLVDSFVVSLDYSRILDLFQQFTRNPVLNLGLGVESRILDIVTLRAGLNEGYPNMGVSLDLVALRLDLAVWGSELGLEPGSRPSFNMMTALEFSY